MIAQRHSHSWRMSVVFGLLLFGLVRPSVSRAEPSSAAEPQPSSSADAAEYERLIAHAIEEYQLGNYAEAYAMFEHAHALRPSARTLRGLGQASFELRKYVRAREYLMAALSDARQPLTAAQRDDVESLLARVASYVGHLNLEVSPDTASVLIDGAPAVRASTLDLGEHAIRASAAGYRTLEQNIMIEGGKTTELALRLLPASPPDPPPSAAARLNTALATKPAAEPSPPIYDHWWFWTGVAAVVVTGAIVTAFATSKPAALPLEKGDVASVIATLHR